MKLRAMTRKPMTSRNPPSVFFKFKRDLGINVRKTPNPNTIYILIEQQGYNFGRNGEHFS